jgi:uncharacterized protein (DUF1778 family)
MVNFRVNADERNRLQSMADEAGLSLSDYVRKRLVIDKAERTVHEKLDRVLEVLNAKA